MEPSVWNVQAVFCAARSTAISLPSCEPTYSILPAIAGDENSGQRLYLRENTNAPDLSSTAYNMDVSDVAKYTLPSFTAGEPITHDPLLLNAHFFCPVAASSAYKFESRQPK